MQSKNLHAVADQGELPFSRSAKPQPVADDVIFVLPSFTASIRLAVNVTGLEEKEIYMPLDIDAGHWTRIMKGDAHFPVDKLNAFCDLVGNEIPLVWWAHSRGKGLHMLETEAEHQLRLARAALDKEREKTEMLTEILRERAK